MNKINKINKMNKMNKMNKIKYIRFLNVYTGNGILTLCAGWGAGGWVAYGGGGGDITIRHTYFQFTYKLSNEITRN